MRSQVVAEFVETSAEARCGLLALETAHRSVSSFDPAMVLLNSVIQILVGPVFHGFVQLSPDRARVTIVSIRRDTRRNDAGHRIGRPKERLRRFHVAVFAQPHVDKGTKTINGTIKITPVSIHLDIRLVNVPTLSDPAFTPTPEVVDQGWSKLRLPIANGLITEFDPPDQEHFRQITQTQFVSKAPEDHERDDVRWILSAVENSATPFIELFAANTASEAPVAARRSLRSFGNLCPVALDAPHFPFPHPGGSYAGSALPGQSILARRMTEPWSAPGSPPVTPSPAGAAPRARRSRSTSWPRRRWCPPPRSAGR